jgi:hypothetical protein
MNPLNRMISEMAHFRRLSDPRHIIKLALAIKIIMPRYENADFSTPTTLRQLNAEIDMALDAVGINDD